MNFRRGRTREEPEINLIAMIDVLLVILIFLMITTTYSRYTGLEIRLPTADTARQQDTPKEINVVINAAGEVLVNRSMVSGRSVADITLALRRAAAEEPPLVILAADAGTPHQRVIDVMQAAQQAGLVQISFATQSPPS